MIIKSKENFLIQNADKRLSLVIQLHAIRDMLKHNRNSALTKKRKKTTKKRKIREPKLLSPKMQLLFDKMDDKSKRYILYGK